MRTEEVTVVPAPVVHVESEEDDDGEGSGLVGAAAVPTVNDQPDTIVTSANADPVMNLDSKPWHSSFNFHPNLYKVPSFFSCDLRHELLNDCGITGPPRAMFLALPFAEQLRLSCLG